MFKKWFKSLAVVLGLSVLVACGSGDDATTEGGVKKEIRFGATTGEFYDMIKYSIAPILEEQGYKVKLIEFTDYVQPNLALANGDLDINVFQHLPYLQSFKKEHGLNIKEGFEVPTAPYGLYPGRLKSLDQVKEGSKVAAPNDPSNFARVLVILDYLGWIELREGTDPLTASKRDITKNILNIDIIELEAANIPRVLDDVDFAAINGNYVLSAGMKLTDSILNEPNFNYINWSAIRVEDEDSQWYQDVKAAYNSERFKEYITTKFPGFQFPSAWGVTSK